MTKKFGDNSKSYPEDMRRQLWPLCCGASIISGFKNVGGMTVDETVKQIETTIKEYIPDHQVYAGETICPSLTFLTLNSSQAASPKIIEAISKAGFTEFAVGKPRGSDQHFYVRDETGTFKLVEQFTLAKAA